MKIEVYFKFIIVFIYLLILIGAMIVACNDHDTDEDIPPESDDDTGESDDDSTPDDACVDEDNDNWCYPEDCRDNNPFVNPGMIEDCFDGFDNDCNSLTDEEDPVCETDDDDTDFFA